MTNWLRALDDLTAQQPVVIKVANDSEKKVTDDLQNDQVEIIDGAIFPSHRYKGEHLPKPIITDLAWLHRRLSSLTKEKRMEMASRYSEVYLQAYETERKEGRARYVANMWILENTYLKTENSAYREVTKLTK